jgi:nicotinic acid mononucleotide adenylyltransferase
MLRVSQETIKQLVADSGKFDFNINHLPLDNSVFKLSVLHDQQHILAEEYMFDSDNDRFVLVRQRGLVEVLAEGRVQNVFFEPQSAVLLANVRLDHSVLLAGSFNPLHHGHQQLLDAAIGTVALDGVLGVFELSVSNCSKSDIDNRELYARAKQFVDAGRSLLITNKPYFRDKVNFVGTGSWFCIGADTFRRFFDVQYYESYSQMVEFSDFLLKRGVKLIVGPRALQSKLETIVDYIDLVPPTYRSEVREVQNFRVDVSSTELRAGRKVSSATGQAETK